MEILQRHGLHPPQRHRLLGPIRQIDTEVSSTCNADGFQSCIWRIRVGGLAPPFAQDMDEALATTAALRDFTKQGIAKIRKPGESAAKIQEDIRTAVVQRYISASRSEERAPHVRKVTPCVRESAAADFWLTANSRLQLRHFAFVSTTVFICARPFSKSRPIILSMLTKTPKALAMKFFWPDMLQVTAVWLLSDLKVNSVSAVEANGLMNSSLMRTRSLGRLSVIVIRPSPTFLSPTQEYIAPVP